MSESVENSNDPEQSKIAEILPKRFNGGIGAMQEPALYSAVSRTNPGRLQKALDLARMSAQFSVDAKAENLLVLDMRRLTSMVDFFVIATVPSRRQATAIASQIEVEMKKRKETKISLEVSETGRWTLLDYGDVVIHLFSPEGREFYNLEDVWGDAPRLDWKDPNLNLE
jgi:ribosome-associated protein